MKTYVTGGGREEKAEDRPACNVQNIAYIYQNAYWEGILGAYG
jgi:hypothetical protein